MVSVLLAMAAQPMRIPSSPLSIWTDAPATEFSASCPVGNGRLGAMMFGGIDDERIVLNENTLWSGGPLDQNRPEAWKARERINELLLQGKNPEAEQLLNQNFTCDGPGSGQGNGKDGPYGCYQTLGDLRIRFLGQDAASNYRRELDLATATARITYTSGRVEYTRELIASRPAESIILRLKASEPSALNADFELTRKERASVVSRGSRDLTLDGQLNNGQEDGMRFGARLRVVPIGIGSVASENGRVRLRGANEALVFVTAGTNYSGPIKGNHLGDDFSREINSQLNRVSSRSWAALEAEHRRDYKSLFDRVQLKLGAPQSSKPTPQRRAIGDPDLMALYFQFGRYLLISSSREGGLPANLQGLWAEEYQTPWNGDYHLDINVQMNYWLAEPGNLSECHLPLTALIESLVEPGKRTARAYYNAPGWLAHVITNPWGFTAPGEHASWGSTNTGSGWLCQHLWQHYEYTQDKTYLERIYPILKSASECYRALLISEPKHGWLVTSPSNSPENAFRMPDGKVAHTCMGPTMDQQIVRELFGNTVKAARLLDIDSRFAAALEQTRALLAPNQIGPDGRLQEWLEPYDEPEPTHRHTSHLYGLHPGNEITPSATPELAEAARKTLERRGDQSTGWSMAWKANFWARLGDGNRALTLLKALLRPIEEPGFGWSGGSYANLFCAHPPFQIDGNFGGAAAIAEMLLQSHEEKDGLPIIRVFPAIPSDWTDIDFRGLRAKAGVQVDAQLHNGHVAITLKRLEGEPGEVWLTGPNVQLAKVALGSKPIRISRD